jgi:hypothetical protein
MRLYAAQAQFRLGTCFLRKGDLASAALAFRAVMANYPNDTALVALAREHMPLPDGLLPEPWGETEVAEYRWSIPGIDEGWSVTRIGLNSSNPRIRIIRMSFYAPQPNVSMVDLSRDRMRPISATYRGPNAALLMRSIKFCSCDPPEAWCVSAAELEPLG